MKNILELIKKTITQEPSSLLYQISIIAIAKNEENYLIEWIAYHKLIGIDHFYIADNSSTDGTRNLLHKLEKIGIVTLVDWPVKKQAQPQWYNYARQHYLHETKYMMFLDLDEFLMDEEASKIKQTLLQLLEKKDTGAVAINWRVMGSAGIRHKNSELVLKKFNMSSRRNRIVNQHVKSIIKPAAVESMSAHTAVLKSGYQYLLSNGSKAQFINNTPVSGRSTHIEETPLKINHYVIKSLEEFIEYKQNRGSAIRGESAIKDMDYFNNHDINDEEFNLPEKTLNQLRAVISELELNISLYNN